MGGAGGLRMLRLANPLVRRVLESRAHGLLSGQLLVLAYRGHRSGREYRIPLRYAELPQGAVVSLAVRPSAKRWWRSFSRSAPARLVLHGARVEARGALVERGERETALAAYLARYPRAARVARDAAVVVFERADG